MANHKLVPYWVEVREAGEPDTSWDQTSIRTNEPEFPADNLADFFENFVTDYTDPEEVFIDEEDKKTFTVESPVKRSGNTIEGRFKSGEWGRNADFWDINEHKRIQDAREENHAEEIPYYFLFHIPDEDSSRALLILSKYKRKGVKTLFSNLFNPRHKDIKIGDAYMTIQPHYSSEVLEEVEEADELASVRFRGKDTIPAREEYADRQDVEKVEQEISGQLDVGTELTMKPKGNQQGFRQFVKGLIPSNDSQDFDYGVIETGQFNSASVTVIEGESELTFSLWAEKFQMRMELDPEEYDLDIHGGHATPHSIGRIARQLANDLMRDRNSSLPTESLIPRTVGMAEEEIEDEISDVDQPDGDDDEAPPEPEAAIDSE